MRWPLRQTGVTTGKKGDIGGREFTYDTATHNRNLDNKQIL